MKKYYEDLDTALIFVRHGQCLSAHVLSRVVISGLQRTHTDDRNGRKPKISHVESQYSHVEDSRKSATI